MGSNRPTSSLSASVSVIEQSTVPRKDDQPNHDRLIVAPGFIGVVDGTTDKPWHTKGGLGGGGVADIVAEGILSADPFASADEVISSINRAIADRLRPLDDEGPRPGATLAVFVPTRSEIWRVGDPWVMIDQSVVPPRDSGERDLADTRALILAERLAAGTSTDTLRAHDPGRAAIIPALAALDRTRHNPESLSGVLDGDLMAAGEIEVLRVPSWTTTVVLATDGYPEIAQTLDDSESLLRERLRRDPLLIEHPPMTKANPIGGNSYDDRTYVRCALQPGRE